MFENSVAVMGGCGHVGLPFAIGLADVGFDTTIYDIDEAKCEMVRSGKMPFQEERADEVLPQVLESGKLKVSSDPSVLSEAQFVVCVVGTPVDEFLNPMVHHFFEAVESIRGHLRDGQVLILRSTLFPRTSERLHQLFQTKGPKVDVTFCPERVAQGKGYVEIKKLPQIISAFTDRGREGAKFLFEKFGVDVIETHPIEAELVKLFNNVWRYVTFAVANQFYTIANDYGIDYYQLHHALTHNYPRGKDLPRPGFAAGPCLFKDTMQLAAFSNNQFFMGHAAMMVNEGMPFYLVERLEKKYNLQKMTVGILGMAFKANCDDTRDSLSFKLRKILSTRCKEVICTDYVVGEEELLKSSIQVKPDQVASTEETIRRSDLLIIGVPHEQYKSINLQGKPVVDIWNLRNQGAVV